MIPADLTTRRVALGLSRAALAFWLNCSERTVRRWERGHVPVPGWLDLALGQIERDGSCRPEKGAET